MDNTKEFKNDHVTVLATIEPNCKAKFDVTVSSKGTEAAYAKAIKLVNKEISLPGFRKGKAPEKLVIQHYAPHVEREFRDLVVQTGFSEALALTKVYPFNEEGVERPQVKSCSHEGAHFTIEFEHYPIVPEINASEIHLEKVQKLPVPAHKFEETIESIRHHHAEWEAITDRPVQEGDFVDLDVDSLGNPAHNICTDTRFEVKPGEMAEWMRKLVIGLKVDESAEGMSEKEENNHDHVHTEHCNHDSHNEFKPGLCRIIVKSILKASLPAVDEQLALKVGSKSVEEMNHSIKASLENQSNEEVKEKLRAQVVKFLSEKFSFDVPASLIETEMNVRVKNKIKGLHKKGISEEQIQAQKDKVTEEARKEAFESLQLFFISRKIAQAHQLGVTQEEIMKELSRQMWMIPVEESVIDSNSMEPDEIRSRLFFKVLSEKVKDFLVNQAQVV